MERSEGLLQRAKAKRVAALEKARELNEITERSGEDSEFIMTTSKQQKDVRSMKWRKNGRSTSRHQHVDERSSRYEADSDVSLTPSKKYDKRYATYLDRRYDAYRGRDEGIVNRDKDGSRGVQAAAASRSSLSYSRDDNKQTTNGGTRGKSHLQRTYEILNETQTSQSRTGRSIKDSTINTRRTSEHDDATSQRLLRYAENAP